MRRRVKNLPSHSKSLKINLPLALDIEKNTFINKKCCYKIDCSSLMCVMALTQLEQNTLRLEPLYYSHFSRFLAELPDFDCTYSFMYTRLAIMHTHMCTGFRITFANNYSANSFIHIESRGLWYFQLSDEIIQIKGIFLWLFHLKLQFNVLHFRCHTLIIYHRNVSPFQQLWVSSIFYSLTLATLFYKHSNFVPLPL